MTHIIWVRQTDPIETDMTYIIWVRRELYRLNWYISVIYQYDMTETQSLLLTHMTETVKMLLERVNNDFMISSLTRITLQQLQNEFQWSFLLFTNAEYLCLSNFLIQILGNFFSNERL